MAWLIGWCAAVYTGVWLANQACVIRYNFEVLDMEREAKRAGYPVVTPVELAPEQVVEIDEGLTADATAIMEIDAQVRDGVMPPQRDMNQRERHAMKALQMGGLITPPGRNTPSEINPLRVEQYDLIVARAVEKVGGK
jgi:hypothetical protein